MFLEDAGVLEGETRFVELGEKFGCVSVHHNHPWPVGLGLWGVGGWVGGWVSCCM